MGIHKLSSQNTTIVQEEDTIKGTVAPPLLNIETAVLSSIASIASRTIAKEAQLITQPYASKLILDTQLSVCLPIAMLLGSQVALHHSGSRKRHIAITIASLAVGILGAALFQVEECRLLGYGFSVIGSAALAYDSRSTLGPAALLTATVLL